MQKHNFALQNVFELKNYNLKTCCMLDFKPLSFWFKKKKKKKKKKKPLSFLNAKCQIFYYFF